VIVFLGSLGYFLSQKDDMEMAMKKASEIATLSVTKCGTQTSYPKKEDLPKELFN